jgi:hypothetical protein
MALLVRIFLCLCLANLIFQALPCYADHRVANDPKESAQPMNSSNLDQEKSTDSKSNAGTAKTSSSRGETDSELASRALIRDLSDPAKKKEALGLVAELLGVASGLMLITGAILAACVKKWGLVKLMLAVGVVGGILAVAAPGLIIMSDSEGLGMALAVFYLILYFAVFFLPTVLALKDKTSKKWIILMINAAGFIIPGAGLVALYLALKDKPVSAGTTAA